jgi:tetratricopeptide (TPR) repeat protein
VPNWQPLLKLSEDVLAVPMRELALAQENQLIHLRQHWLAARGAVLCRLGRYQEAMTSLQESVGPERKTGNDAAWVFLALAHLRLGRRAEAAQCMNKVLAHKAAANFSWEALEVELLRPVVADLQKEMGAPNQ